MLPRARRRRCPAIASATTRTARCRSPTRSTSAAAIVDLRNDYYEDPVWGMPQLARLKEFVPIPIATNTRRRQLRAARGERRNRARSTCVLLDTTFWGGIRPCIKAAGVCETLGIGVAVHSSGELGIQLATMLHLGAVLPNLGYAADAHYHHLHRRRDRRRQDDAIANGAIAVPDGTGLGVALDRDEARAIPRALSRAGRLPVRSRPRPAGLVSDGAESRLGGSGRTR